MVWFVALPYLLSPVIRLPPYVVFGVIATAYLFHHCERGTVALHNLYELAFCASLTCTTYAWRAVSPAAYSLRSTMTTTGSFADPIAALPR